MSQGMEPAHAAEVLCRTLNSMSSNNKTNGDSIDATSNCQQVQCHPGKSNRVNNGGNYCGHDPLLIPYYIEPENQKRRFHVIEEAKRRILNALNNPYDYPMFHALLFHGNGRHIRSERMEAELYQLLPAIVDTVNLGNMMLGYYSGTGQFINYGFKKLVELTGLSYSRVERNMAHLQKAGLVKVEVISIYANDGFKTERVKIWVSDQVFKMLGLDNDDEPESSLFLKDRQKALANRQKMENRSKQYAKHFDSLRPKTIQSSVRDKKAEKQAHLVSNDIRSLTKQLTLKPQRHAPQGRSAEHQKKISKAVLDLLKLHPGMTSREALNHVLTYLEPPPS